MKHSRTVCIYCCQISYPICECTYILFSEFKKLVTTVAANVKNFAQANAGDEVVLIRLSEEDDPTKSSGWWIRIGMF